MLRPLKLSLEETEVIALKALTFLARDTERFDRFVALSGVSLGDIREAAADRRFLAGVLNHLLQDESLLLTFTADEELDPRFPALAAELLNRSSD
ncbi:MAG: DUF3572 domain-containing protein [Parvibaculaceae bacterium]